jgi:prepilin-type N-terminal cleavage/methylation domain-containing protein
MKTPFNKGAKHGFTLVELLVVIVIISILATLGFSVGVGALHKARKVTALSAATNIANAVEQFYSEYHVLPDPTDAATEDNGASPYVTDSGDGVTLLEILAGFEDEQNERKIRFLSVKEAEKGNRGGIVYNGTGDAVVGLFDPWGEPYYIVLDYDYDGRLEFTPSGAYTYDAKLNNKRVAVYCLGTDTPSDAKRKDLVKTW